MSHMINASPNSELDLVISTLADELIEDPSNIRPEMTLGELGINSDIDLLSLSHRIEERIGHLYLPGTQNRVEFLTGSKNPDIEKLTVESVAANIRSVIGSPEKKEAA